MDAETPEKSSSAWTEEAKLKEDGRAIKWEKINIPGRTIKSLQNMWTKINKQIADFEARENSGEGSAAATPVKVAKKRGPPRKKNVARMLDFADDGLDDADFGLKRALSKKRAAEGMGMTLLGKLETTMVADMLRCVHLELGDESLAAALKRSKVKAEAGDGVRCKKEER
ncbi:hypothetical protein TARUN_3457 [Trichoderma arundinaceum]|uniref:Uncharacterized protein n=1 Tax=Trichoderma arundinaceum TaxID=490622 RepID=A0A395NS29_TRIAR|nr:hypothetical protein TARUN_3457 [Trichoderma arundinaceum]